jgi:repressor LexA
MDMSKRIKELRLEKGLTLEQVGNIVGVGKSTVRKWETGMIANMKKITALLLKSLKKRTIGLR